MSKLTKFFLTLIFAGMLLVPAITLSQETEAPLPEVTEAVNLDEDIQPEDLGITEPRLLPDNPFYFLKNWAREIRSFFTFDPVRRAELRMKFANEKLMEVRKIVEMEKNLETIKRAIENYQEGTERVRRQTERIRERARENLRVESFLDKFIHQQTLHQKLLQRLEAQVPPPVFEKIKEAREEHLKRFQEVMLKLEDRHEKITQKLDKILEEQEGSQFKEFKNLEVLKNLEEKLPEEAREAIRRAQENALKRLQRGLEEMSPENQEKFQEYVGKISGQKEKHLEIMGNLRAEIRTRKLREVDNEKVEMIRDLEEKIGKGKTKIIERVSEIVGGKIDCPFWAPPIPGFCKEGRMIIEKDPETGCPLPPRCIIPGEIEIPKPPLPIQPVPPERPEPGFCITIWDPVCGKDGKTYSNECFARLAGVEVDYKGVCRPIEKPIPEPPIRIPEPPIRIPGPPIRIPEPPIRIPEPPIRIPGPPIERPIIGPLIPLIERPTEMPEIMPPPPIR